MRYPIEKKMYVVPIQSKTIAHVTTNVPIGIMIKQALDNWSGIERRYYTFEAFDISRNIFNF